jgi:hypothetical protein
VEREQEGRDAVKGVLTFLKGNMRLSVIFIWKICKGQNIQYYKEACNGFYKAIIIPSIHNLYPNIFSCLDPERQYSYKYRLDVIFYKHKIYYECPRRSYQFYQKPNLAKL